MNVWPSYRSSNLRVKTDWKISHYAMKCVEKHRTFMYTYIYMLVREQKEEAEKKVCVCVCVYAPFYFWDGMNA